jgi:hypothetical protein
MKRIMNAGKVLCMVVGLTAAGLQVQAADTVASSSVKVVIVTNSVVRGGAVDPAMANAVVQAAQYALAGVDGGAALGQRLTTNSVQTAVHMLRQIVIAGGSGGFAGLDQDIAEVIRQALSGLQAGTNGTPLRTGGNVSTTVSVMSVTNGALGGCTLDTEAIQKAVQDALSKAMGAAKAQPAP